jgi:hypothetical protein
VLSVVTGKQQRPSPSELPGTLLDSRTSTETKSQRTTQAVHHHRTPKHLACRLVAVLRHPVERKSSSDEAPGRVAFELEDDKMTSNNCSHYRNDPANAFLDFEHRNGQVSRPSSEGGGQSMPFAMSAAANHQDFDNIQRHSLVMNGQYRDRGDNVLAAVHVSNMTGSQDVAVGTEALPPLYHTSVSHDSPVVPSPYLGYANLDHIDYSDAADNLRGLDPGVETIYHGNAAQYQTLQGWHSTNVPHDFFAYDSSKNNDPGMCYAAGPSSSTTPTSYNPWHTETYMTTAGGTPSALPLIELDDVEPAPRRSSRLPWSPDATFSPPQEPSYGLHVPSLGDLTDNRSLSEYSHEPYSATDETVPLLTPATSTNANMSELLTPCRKPSQKTRPTLGRRKSKVSTTSCGTCDTTFTGSYRKGNFQRHVRLVHGDRDFPCQEPGCPKTYKRQDARLKHYRSKHPHLAGAPLSRKLHRST